MQRRVRTPDGVGWTVSVRRPVVRGDGGDLVVGDGDESGGFGPLLVAATVLLLVLLTPVLVKTERWWALAFLPVLLVVGWLLLARYPVELRRDGSQVPMHRTLVAGRVRARRIADELGDEIERTPDARLTG
ncbi:hypothetical protein [Aeromicrobium sp.]|uniref:hypothetical protein n=1 Tax=Aeromicrobium sp. TaxID=1871063 RepID=UPI0028AF9DC8|nr:hypothetical protein [Aeromicrobium sp.]